ncbi:MAG TPA: metallophosphoesterase family protein [Candidatus Limnocylindria bacterium]|jgi:diadenosine tetraphosphatase ApaH/serine/threonine PP2A family protein phosphatase
MRLAVLSDIHANLAALDAVREDLPTVDQTWVLGDIVGYGPQPNEVIRALQEMGARSVMGNHDGAAIGTVDASWFNPDAASAIEWTAQVVDDNARAYLAALPEVRRDGELTAVHGSPRDPTWEYVTGPGVAAANLSAFDTRLCLHGHTHVPVIFSAEDGRVEVVPATPDAPLRLNAGRALVNPGSVGQPRDGNPAASYLVLDTDSGLAEFRRVTYDVARTQQLMGEAGLPARLAERLSYGR